MRPIPLTLILLFVAVAAAPALAGSPDAPELADEAGDCANALGNEYLDIVAAWISDETATDFTVNLALEKWQDVVAHGAGFTVQFTHQDTQWGVFAIYDRAFSTWYYSTGTFTDDGAGGWNDTTGSFAPGAPAVISVQFPKDIFPHTEAMDHTLHTFMALSVDIKPAYAYTVAAMAGAPYPPLQEFIPCDEATGDGVYVFQVGQHSMENMDDMEENAMMGEDVPDMAEDAETNSTLNASQSGEVPDRESPAAAVPLLLAAFALAASRRHK